MLLSVVVIPVSRAQKETPYSYVRNLQFMQLQMQVVNLIITHLMVGERPRHATYNTVQAVLVKINRDCNTKSAHKHDARAGIATTST